MIPTPIASSGSGGPRDAPLPIIISVVRLSFCLLMLKIIFTRLPRPLTHFPDAAHLSSWAGVCPGHNESAGKRLSGRSTHGNRYVKAVLVQAAHGVRRSRTYLGEPYRRPKKRRGSKRAALAIGHNILVIYYQMMKTGEEYQEKVKGFSCNRIKGKWSIG